MEKHFGTSIIKPKVPNNPNPNPNPNLNPNPNVPNPNLNQQQVIALNPTNPSLGHSPNQIASQPKVRDVKISPDGKLILYQVTPFYRAGDRTLSELWIAEVNKCQSAIRISGGGGGGEFNDRGGVFHPDGQSVLFLSDRGRGGQVGSLPISDGKGVETKIGTGTGAGTFIYTILVKELKLDEPRDGKGKSESEGEGFGGSAVEFRGNCKVKDGDVHMNLDLDLDLNSKSSAIGLETAETTVYGKVDSEEMKMKMKWKPNIPVPRILTPKFGKRGVQGFEISPNGKFIAFTGLDETSQEEIQRNSEKNDARVIGSKTGLAKLRIYDYEKDEIFTLNNIRTDKHIEAVTWSPDSKCLLYRLRENKGSEWAEFDVVLEMILVVDENAKPRLLGKYSRSPSGSNIWLSSNHISSLQNYEPSNTLDARTLHIHHYNSNNLTYSERIYGIEDDAVRILPAFNKHDSSLNSSESFEPRQDFLAVEVSHDTDSHINIITFKPGYPQHTNKFTLFQTSSDAIWFNSWDAKRILDPTNPNFVTYVFAAVLSSGPRHEPPNVWSGTIQVPIDENGKEDGQVPEVETLSRSKNNLIQLSDHLRWLVDAPVLRTEVIKWKTEDGMELSGLVRFPPNYNPKIDGRLPTVLFLHGGPYRRDIPDYMPYFCNFRELFASSGYLTISPNYRGSQGRGHKFATYSNKGIGIYDWNDSESMIDEVIKLGWSDENRLGVAGWSHGGSITAWGVTLSKRRDRFKAAVVGAGATNWEGMVMESGSPELETAIGQSSPWIHRDSSTIGNANANTDMKRFMPERKSSPVNNVKGVNTAVLILHGEKDERVPPGQAIGFYRGLKRFASPRGRDAVELVMYPREPHGFVERRHAQDVLERVLGYFARYI